jgi:hypothetical protein
MAVSQVGMLSLVDTVTARVLSKHGADQNKSWCAPHPLKKKKERRKEEDKDK